MIIITRIGMLILSFLTVVADGSVFDQGAGIFQVSINGLYGSGHSLFLEWDEKRFLGLE